MMMKRRRRSHLRSPASSQASEETPDPPRQTRASRSTEEEAREEAAAPGRPSAETSQIQSCSSPPSSSPPPRHQMLRPPRCEEAPAAGQLHVHRPESLQRRVLRLQGLSVDLLFLFSSSSSSSSHSRTGPSKALKLGGPREGCGVSEPQEAAPNSDRLQGSDDTEGTSQSALSLRALNLQSVRSVSKAASGSGQQGGARASLRSGAIVKRGGVKVGGVVEQQLADSPTGSGSAERKLNELSTGDSDEYEQRLGDGRRRAMFPASIVPRPAWGGGARRRTRRQTGGPRGAEMETVCVTDVTATSSRSR
ncbi:hypothetical protein CgunFtcFv8_001421 [Champsocephalus gunnari]|uniref:Uncharacterized protein n=1 Tax=Champsocephalus gunnari TaxID=52237 RepID=A0AAN8CKL5_CHAGU|nr:hypothetical protein CgunFtcFv8_001421 [Champsocephalus gunnari]